MPALVSPLSQLALVSVVMAKDILTTVDPFPAGPEVEGEKEDCIQRTEIKSSRNSINSIRQ